MLNDREFLDGVYAKAKQLEKVQESETKKSSFRFLKNTGAVLAAAIFLFCIISPAYFNKSSNDLAEEPKAAPALDGGTNAIAFDAEAETGAAEATYRLPEVSAFGADATPKSLPNLLELVQDADVIAVGSIKEIELGEQNEKITVEMISENIYKGQIALEKTKNVQSDAAEAELATCCVVLPDDVMYRNSDDVLYREGEKTLFFLKTAPDDTYNLSLLGASKFTPLFTENNEWIYIGNDGYTIKASELTEVIKQEQYP